MIMRVPLVGGQGAGIACEDRARPGDALRADEEIGVGED